MIRRPPKSPLFPYTPLFRSNLHHADPTCARHGVLRGQIDISARIIWFFEKLGWARDVKWPDPVRLAAKRDRKSTRLNSSHANISYAVFCLKKKKKIYYAHSL